MFQTEIVICRKNLVEAEWATDDNTIWRMRIACWITKVTCTHNI